MSVIQNIFIIDFLLKINYWHYQAWILWSHVCI